MEVTVLKGRSTQVQTVANQVIAERGVRHGRLIMIPAEIDFGGHKHHEDDFHYHIRIK
jgi:CopG family nickel-responsive transcriptional regulator